MMTELFLLVALAATPGATGTDTTFAVSQGTRLKVQNQGGDIIVKAWDRNQVRIQAEHSSRAYLSVEQRGQILDVSTKSRRGFGAMTDYQIMVPAWMAVDLGGMYATISVEGTKAAIKAETLEGDIEVRGGADVVTLKTVNGRIDLTGARGRIELNAISDDVFVTDAEGDLVVEPVSGEIDLRRVAARSLDVQTVSGDIVFDGRITSGGSYALSSHSGDVTVAIPEGSNATISVSSAGGEVSSTMNLRAEREGRRRQVYRLGNGGASLEIETFNGDVDLLRPSELTERRPESDLKQNRKNRSHRERDDRDDDHDAEHESER